MNDGVPVFKVPTFVVLTVAGTREIFSAECAGVRLFTSVGPDVHAQVSFLRKIFVTRWTLELFHFFMNRSLVSLKIIASAE